MDAVVAIEIIGKEEKIVRNAHRPTHSFTINKILLIVVMMICCVLPQSFLCAQAQDTIRVAFVEQDGISYYQNGNKPTGYNYDYLEKVAEYTGWKFEYVSYTGDDAIEEALQDIKDGKVDLYGPIVKNEEITDAYEVGNESYGTLYTTLEASTTSTLKVDAISNLNGLKVGLLKNQEKRNKEVKEFLDANKTTYVLFYYDSKDELEKALQDGIIDLASSSSLEKHSDTKIIEKFEPKQYYFISTKGNTTQINELDDAIQSIQDAQPLYQDVLFERYFQETENDFVLSEDKKNYLKEHNSINVLCVDNDAPYVYMSEGQASGFLVSLLNDFSNVTGVSIEYTFCDSKDEIQAYLNRNEYDIIIGIPFTSDYCADIGYVRSKEISEAGIAMLYRSNCDPNGTVIVQQGLEDLVDTENYSNVIYAENVKDCIQALNDDEADVAIGDRSAFEYYLYDNTKKFTVVPMSGTTQKIVLALSRNSDLEFKQIINQYINSLTDLQLTNYLASGNQHSSKMNLWEYISAYPVQSFLIVCLIIAILTGSILTAFYSRKIKKKNQQLEKAVVSEKKHSEIIDSLATIYKATYLVELKTHEYFEIKTNDQLNQIAKESGNTDKKIEEVLHKCVSEEYYDEMQEFYDLEKIKEKLKNQNTISTIYLDTFGDWYESRYIVKSRNENGDAEELIYVSRNCSTEKKQELQMQEELKETAKQADSANRAKTEFLQRMSHDIRTPINGIRGMLDIAEYYNDDPTKQEECREKIRDSSNLLLELVNEVLDMGKLESGEIVIESIPFQLDTVIKEIRTVIENQAAERGIQINMESNVKHTNLIGSPSHLKRLLMNILSNAVKYNKDNGTIEFTVKELNVIDDQVTLEFVCKDTGIGMSEEFQQHMFEPFTQEHSSARTKINGTGLGMSITKKLTEKMNGSIHIDSMEDVGTTFTVVLPFGINASMPIEDKEMIEEKNSIDGLNVLLVEDNELNMEISKFVLEESGCEVTCAWNGEEAVQKFEESNENFYDVILMDVMMPIMDGYQATKKIRSLERIDATTVPIVAMTANAFTEDKILARQSGMNEHLSKPLDKQLIIETISRLVKERKGS